ncbi:hypothetical protein Bca52824_080165 [Brassica carinata]|uniref:Uncharacterized protein n=1 Tax=Brassica carinata TaxID=52824 RepID=A0A8X7U2L1_BRACI|nr:hypothetical protein Bca52824_080165 [Brassica carinata]
MPRKIALGGRYSRDLFNRHGDLRHIRRLRFWPMNKKRSSVSQCLLHAWINSAPRSLEPSLSPQDQKPETQLDREKEEIKRGARSCV